MRAFEGGPRSAQSLHGPQHTRSARPPPQGAVGAGARKRSDGGLSGAAGAPCMSGAARGCRPRGLPQRHTGAGAAARPAPGGSCRREARLPWTEAGLGPFGAAAAVSALLRPRGSRGRLRRTPGRRGGRVRCRLLRRACCPPARPVAAEISADRGAPGPEPETESRAGRPLRVCACSEAPPPACGVTRALPARATPPPVTTRAALPAAQARMAARAQCGPAREPCCFGPWRRSRRPPAGPSGAS